MRYPEFLPDNGTIGFVAPSFGCSIDPYKTCFENALERFREMGYKTKPGPNSFAGEGIGISNRPELCGKELNEMYADPEPDVIISCGGGELMCEVVPYIDWEAIRSSKPKWYMGYSDNTNFTFLSTILADTAAIYGPCAPAFGTDVVSDSLKDAFNLLKGSCDVHNYPKWELESLKDEEHPTNPYNMTEDYRQRIYISDPEKGPSGDHNSLSSLKELSQVEMEGRLIGGCVDILIMLCGTRFDRTKDFLEKYKDDGFIWFLECCDLNPMMARRAFFQMREAGWFKYVKGFLIGRSLHYNEEMMGLDMYTSITGAIKDLGVPIIMDLDIGHLPPQMPIISGSYGKVHAAENSIRIEQKLI